MKSTDIRKPALENNLVWLDIRDSLPPPGTTCLVLAGSPQPILRQFMKKKFAKGRHPVTHYVVLYYTNEGYPWSAKCSILYS